MPQWTGILAAAASGAVLGAIGLSLLTLLFWALFAREAFKDGQFVMVFLATVPCGGMLGCTAGVSLALLSRGNSQSAGWVCLVGGMLVAGLNSFFAFIWALGEPGWLRRFLLGLVHPGHGAPFLWAVALMLWGEQLLQQR